jgi:hypothetical protein
MNGLIAPIAKDAESNTLAHVAARLGGPVSRHLTTIPGCEARIEASSSVTIYDEWQRRSALTFSYRLASCSVLIAVDDVLAEVLLERKLGGGQADVPRRAKGQCRATAWVARDLADSVSRSIGEVWPGGKPGEIIASSDVVQFARANDNVPTITLALPWGEIRVAFAVEGIARINGAPVPPRVPDWTARLRASATSVRLPVRAILARPEFPAATVMRLSVGDVLPISKPTSVPLYAGAHRVATGVLTENDGRTAVQIQMMEYFR